MVITLLSDLWAVIALFFNAAKMKRLNHPLLILTILSSSFALVIRQIDVPVQTKCSGGFDVYFVLDT